MNRSDISIRFIGIVALTATVGAGQSLAQTPEGPKNTQQQLTNVVELPGQTLTFQPTREDITVGCAILSLHHLITISANGRDHAIVIVGDHNLFESTKRYSLARVAGTWEIDKIENLETGW